MKHALGALLASLVLLLAALPAQAHFMVTYTPRTAMEKAEDLDFRLVFTHPAEAGHTMDMGGFQDFYAVYKRGKNQPERIELKGLLKEITWKNPESANKAYSALVPKKTVRSLGDYVFVLVPGYYYEKEEDVYMQQIAKLIVNVGGIPGNWAEPVGLPCEIVPLIKPYGLWTGNVFKAQVLSEGKPVAGAEVEVEYMSHMPDLAANAMPAASSVEYPGSALVTQTIFSDAQGYITFGVPRAGWWGFAALGVGPAKEHKGKELSQDAVIWVQAVDMK